MNAVQDHLEHHSVMQIAGPLHASVCATLARDVRSLIAEGRGVILLDLSHVSGIDAAGVGALVHVYNMATAAGAALRITNAFGYVRDLLERVALFDLLTAEPGTSEPTRLTNDRPWMCGERVA